VARALGLGYPGGPAIDRVARTGRPDAVKLPLPFATEASFDFSFSGLKTAVVRLLMAVPSAAAAPEGGAADGAFAADIAAAFQENLVERSEEHTSELQSPC